MHPYLTVFAAIILVQATVNFLLCLSSEDPVFDKYPNSVPALFLMLLLEQ